jgi:hypothetical protein
VPYKRQFNAVNDLFFPQRHKKCVWTEDAENIPYRLEDMHHSYGAVCNFSGRLFVSVGNSLLSAIF